MILTVFIATILLLFIFLLMSIGYLFNNKGIKSTCGTDENPCTCSLIEKYKCLKAKINIY